MSATPTNKTVTSVKINAAALLISRSILMDQMTPNTTHPVVRVSIVNTKTNTAECTGISGFHSLTLELRMLQL